VTARTGPAGVTTLILPWPTSQSHGLGRSPWRTATSCVVAASSRGREVSWPSATAVRRRSTATSTTTHVLLTSTSRDGCDVIAVACLVWKGAAGAVTWERSRRRRQRQGNYHGCRPLRAGKRSFGCPGSALTPEASTNTASGWWLLGVA